MTDRVDHPDRDARMHAPDELGHETGTQPTAGLSEDSPSRQPPKGQNRSLGADAAHELIRNPIFVISSLVALAIVSMAVAPKLWTGVNPHKCDLANARLPPTEGHPFGYTVLGCDMYAQVIHGARASVVIAVVCTIGIFLGGVTIGALAAYYGGILDTLLMRLTDVIFGIPFVLAALLILSILDSHSIWVICGILIVFGWPQIARIMRGAVLEIKVSDYIRASRALGAGNRRILLRHVMPNAISPSIVIATISLGGFVSAEATLSFLGVGLQRPAISWGLLIGFGQDWALSGFWWLLVYPCAFLVATVLSFILIGDAVRDALDPKLQ